MSAISWHDCFYTKLFLITIDILKLVLEVFTPSYGPLLYVYHCHNCLSEWSESYHEILVVFEMVSDKISKDLKLPLTTPLVFSISLVPVIWSSEKLVNIIQSFTLFCSWHASRHLFKIIMKLFFCRQYNHAFYHLIQEDIKQILILCRKRHQQWEKRFKI